MVKILVLYSGGLDSKLAVKLLQEQGLNVECLFFKLPFIKQEIPELNGKGIKFHVLDVTKEKLLKEYLEIIKKPRYGYGAGVNPCIDCRIFMFKKAKEYADKEKIDIIASGEVLGERPMSQTSQAIKIIDNEIGFEILRPLSAKLLSETSYEKKGLVDRNKFFDFQGRGRKKQIELAKKFNMSYPSPAGGCLLCEKELARRLKLLLGKNLINEKTLKLTKIGRHFYIDYWFVVGRDEKENLIIEKFKNSIKSGKGKPAVYFDKIIGGNKAKALQKAYEEKNPKKFEKFKL